MEMRMGYVCMSNVFLFNVIMSSELYVILSNSWHMFNASQRRRRTWCTQFSIEQDRSMNIVAQLHLWHEWFSFYIAYANEYRNRPDRVSLSASATKHKPLP
jgi:hypothetical protein